MAPKDLIDDDDDDLDDLDAVDVSNDVLAAAGRGRMDDDDDDSDDDDDDSDDDSDDDDADSDDADDDSDDDDAGSDDDDHADLTAVPKVKRKKKQTAEERIAELTAARRAAEKAAFEAEMRVLELEKAQKPAATDKELKAPDSKDFVYGEVDPEYQEALVDYRVATKLAEQEAQWEAARNGETEEARNAKYATKLAEVMEKGAKRHDDFEEVVGSTKYDAHLARMILDSESPVDIAYFLSHNVDELLKATRASPEERARIIGRLEGRFSVASTGRKKRTSAPPPLGTAKKRKPAKTEVKYGPSDQDAFDEAFYGK